MAVSNPPIDLPQALGEIDRLKSELANAQRVRDAYWRTIRQMLPTAPPEFELSDEEFAAALANPETVDDFLDQLFREKGAA